MGESEAAEALGSTLVPLFIGGEIFGPVTLALRCVQGTWAASIRQQAKHHGHGEPSHVRPKLAHENTD